MTRRRRFQLRLSTAILLMLAASALVWANTRTTLQNEVAFAISTSTPENFIGSRTFAHGWPFAAVTITHSFHSLNWSVIDRTQSARATLKPNAPEIHWPLILANAAIAVVILAVIAAITEFILRHKHPPA